MICRTDNWKIAGFHICAEPPQLRVGEKDGLEHLSIGGLVEKIVAHQSALRFLHDVAPTLRGRSLVQSWAYGLCGGICRMIPCLNGGIRFAVVSHLPAGAGNRSASPRVGDSAKHIIH